MSRHTTSFTADPVYRARQELRNRLERIRDEAEVTAGAVGAFPGNEAEHLMWQALVALCEGYIGGIDQINEAERLNKAASTSAARRTPQVGTELPDFFGTEPA